MGAEPNIIVERVPTTCALHFGGSSGMVDALFYRSGFIAFLFFLGVLKAMAVRKLPSRSHLVISLRIARCWYLFSGSVQRSLDVLWKDL